MENHMEQVAEQFVNAIKTIAEKPENLDNLQWYLSYHFEAWVKKYANTPDSTSTFGIETVSITRPDSVEKYAKRF